MKKMISFFIIMLVLLCAMTSLVTSEKQDHKIRKEHIVFSEPLLKETTYSTIHIISSESYFMDEGKPMLPRHTETFTFPFGTDIKDVRCIVKNIQHIELSKQLELAPKMISVGSMPRIEDEESSHVLNDIYPVDWYDFDVGCGIVGDERVIIVKVDISPARYDPIEHHISWAEEIDIEIDYEENTVHIHTDDEFDLLIISPLSFAAQIQPLVDHKNSRDIPTKLVTLNEIASGEYFPARGRDDIEGIKYFIKDAIENWLITNVLIIGGASDVPARETHVFVGEDDDEIFVSDLYYADIYDGEHNFSSWDSNGNDIFAEYNWDEETDDIDFYPDVKIGRLACIDTEQVTTAVNKIITYESSKAYTQNWFNNIVVIGGDTVPESYGDDSDTDEGERVNQFILDRMQGFIPDRIWDSNGRLSGLITTGLDTIKTGIENGCGFLDFSGHGGSWVWTTFPHNGERQTLPTPTGRYTNTIIGELRNGDMLPIVINGGCSLGKYQEDDNCNAWAFIANPYGGGIASFGATGLGYVYVGKYITEGLVEGLNIDIIEAYRDGAITFGEMYTTGLNTYIHSSLSDGDHKTLMEWHAFGDPTLQIGEESNPPEKPSRPEGPSSGRKGETYEYSSSSTDIDGDDLYYLFDWDDGTYSGWVGPYVQGQEVSASKTWDEKGDFQIRVKVKDEHGKQSEWSDPLAISMPYTYGKSIHQFFDSLFQRFPLSFPKLRQLVEY